MFRRSSLVATGWLLCLAVAAPGLAEEQKGAEGPSQFIRLTRTGDGSPVALEVAVVRFVPLDCGKNSPTVDLVSAVHVAEKSYYHRLNALLRKYDAVLYELVAPEGTTVPPAGKSRGTHPVSALQQGMTKMLELEFQLRGIDYNRPNFVHADMSAEQFAESMRRRGESMFQIFFRMMGYAIAQQASNPGDGDLRLLMALFSKDRALAMKRVLAEQLEDMEGSLTVIDGPDGSTLVSERNKVALGVLGKQIAKGKKSLAIFYGAAHMPDLSKRLRAEYGLAPIQTQWLVAWSLSGKAGE
jgi:hypothetical protein